MKKSNYLFGLKTLLLLIVLFVWFAEGNAQKPVSQRIKDQLMKQFKSLRKPEVTFDEFLKVNRHVLENKGARSGTGSALSRIGCSSPLNSQCGNGDFESGVIDPNEWSGGYGTFGGGQPDPFTLTDGITPGSGSINDFNSHQTIVGVGPDPTVPIQQVAADGGAYAVRIGNRVNNFGTEYLSKTFVVSADKTVFPFRYAVVFQDPGHDFVDQPAFSVRAFDCSGNELPPVCDLGNGSNIAVSNAANPFFQSTTAGGFGLLAYRDWSQAQIDLSAYVGQTITVVFLNKDCGLGGHWGYTYLDNLCTVCTSGCPYNLSLSPNSTTCGKGQICFDYSLPTTGGNTGNLVIDLSIYQNGVQVGSTISSPVLTSGTSYCFNIDPSTLGINTGLGGFDYVAKGRFTLNNFPLSPIFVGNPPNGQIPGTNNDYGTVVPSCSITSVPSDNTYTGGNPNNLYLGYGPQSTTLKVNASGGGGFTYSWSPATGLSNTTSSAPVFTPTAPGTYTFTVTVTNAIGCSSTCSITICVLDIRVPGTSGKKVYVCHTPPGNPTNVQTLSISVNAVSAHIFNPGHGDHLGTCEQTPCSNGQRSLTSELAGVVIDESALNGLTVEAIPNPSSSDFKLLVQSKHGEPVTISIANVYGRVVYTRTNVVANTTISVGRDFPEGTYYVEVKQGSLTSQIKLMKTK